MPTTADQFVEAQQWIGAESQATFDARYDRLGGLNSAILESMRTQLAILISEPGNIHLPDGTSVDSSANITALKELIRQFLSIGGLPAVEDQNDPPPPGGIRTNSISRARGIIPTGGGAPVFRGRSPGLNR